MIIFVPTLVILALFKLQKYWQHYTRILIIRLSNNWFKHNRLIIITRDCFSFFLFLSLSLSLSPSYFTNLTLPLFIKQSEQCLVGMTCLFDQILRKMKIHMKFKWMHWQDFSFDNDIIRYEFVWKIFYLIMFYPNPYFL